MPPVLLCTDFDETITQRDTTSILFQLASCSKSTEQQLVTQYVTELEELLKSYESSWRRQELVSKFDGAGLREFLEGYAAADLRSTQRVVKCRALEGIRRSDIVAAASTVQLRANCAETLAAVEQWEVLSANWSTELVAFVLQHAEVATPSSQIIANELKVDEDGVSTGEIDLKVQSPVDKERRVAELRSRLGETQSTVVYVGDSATDLLAMLEADVGVWLDSDATLSSSKLLKQLVGCYGVDARPLTSCNSLLDCTNAKSDEHRRSGDGRPVIFTATEWSQIRAVVGERLRNRCGSESCVLHSLKPSNSEKSISSFSVSMLSINFVFVNKASLWHGRLKASISIAALMEELRRLILRPATPCTLQQT